MENHGFKETNKDHEPIKKLKKSPWSFEAPPYDQRTSVFVSAGVDHGVGLRNPVGHENAPKRTVATLPMTVKVAKARNVSIEVET